MAEAELNGLDVAILVTDGFEQVDMTTPRKALDDAGVVTCIVLPQEGRVRTWKSIEWSDGLPIDVKLDRAQLQDFTRCCSSAA